MASIHNYLPTTRSQHSTVSLTTRKQWQNRPSCRGCPSFQTLYIQHYVLFLLYRQCVLWLNGNLHLNFHLTIFNVTSSSYYSAGSLRKQPRRLGRIRLCLTQPPPTAQYTHFYYSPLMLWLGRCKPTQYCRHWPKLHHIVASVTPRFYYHLSLPSIKSQSLYYDHYSAAELINPPSYTVHLFMECRPDHREPFGLRERGGDGKGIATWLCAQRQTTHTLHSISWVSEGTPYTFLCAYSE